MTPPEPVNGTRLATVFAVAAIPLFFLILWSASGLPVFVWDAIWYREIASGGYQFNGNVLQQQNVAFLPGYPLLIGLLHAITGIDVIRSQYVVSVSCYIAGSICFHQTFCKRFSAKQSLLAIGIFSINPFAIYLFNGYSECLLYLLCGIFFLTIDKRQYSVAAVALSYALITRPHAVVLYPVLIYKLADDHGVFDGGFRPSGQRSTAFIRSSAEYLFLTLLFPILLTIFWYVRFGDSLLYLNALTAWGAAGSNSVFRQAGLLISSLLQIQTIDVVLSSGTIKVLAPHQFAAWNVLLNLGATAYLVNRKYYELAGFCASLLTFWFFNSVSADSGRHALLLVALPITLSSALLAATSPRAWNKHFNATDIIRRLGLGLAATGFILVSLFHYMMYALIQLNGGWIS